MRRLALIAAAGIALAGCGGSHASSSGPRPHSHDPPAVAPLHAPRVRHFAQLLSPTRLGIVTTGSSSCPSVPDELVVVTPHNIRIHLTVGSWDRGKLVEHPPPGGVCTADYGTTQMVLTIDPKLIAVQRPLTVEFLYPDSKKPLVRVAAPLNG